MLLALLLFAQTEAQFWAYTLEDQNEPELLALRTPYGTHRVQPVLNCHYIQANQNVLVVSWQGSEMWFVAEGEGYQPYCHATSVAQMDDVPCFMNDVGNCDIRVENNATYTD